MWYQMQNLIFVSQLFCEPKIALKNEIKSVTKNVQAKRLQYQHGEVCPKAPAVLGSVLVADRRP